MSKFEKKSVSSLKSTENFNKLSEEVSPTEGGIAAARGRDETFTLPKPILGAIASVATPTGVAARHEFSITTVMETVVNPFARSSRAAIHFTFSSELEGGSILELRRQVAGGSWKLVETKTLLSNDNPIQVVLDFGYEASTNFRLDVIHSGSTLTTNGDLIGGQGLIVILDLGSDDYTEDPLNKRKAATAPMDKVALGDI